LIERLVEGIDADEWRLVCGLDPPERSTMVVLEPRHESVDDATSRLARARIDVAERRGRIRISPHLYNSVEDIDRTLTALA
jgi:selenocysteine lyase/cysteine desulfurase